MQAPTSRHFIHGAIFILANRMQALEDRVAGGQISTKQWFVLLAASQMQQPTATKIAREVGASRQNTTKLLQQLAQKGLVRITTDESDRRSHSICLTCKAKQEMELVGEKGGVFVQRMLRGVTEEEVAITRQALEKILGNLEQMGKETRLQETEGKG